MARLESSRAIFAPGESLPTLHCDEDYVLSSDSRITCRYDGSWSEIVMCEKGKYTHKYTMECQIYYAYLLHKRRWLPWPSK